MLSYPQELARNSKSSAIHLLLAQRKTAEKQFKNLVQKA
jgi:hypothetical protein